MRGSHIIYTRCESCHSYSLDDSLNLTKWLPDLGTFEFKRGGVQLSSDEVFSAIKSRLSTPDPYESMPPGGNMPISERTRLIEWIDGLNGGEE